MEFCDILLKVNFKTADFVQRATRELIEIGHHKKKESLGTERKGPNITTHFKDERQIMTEHGLGRVIRVAGNMK